MLTILFISIVCVVIFTSCNIGTKPHEHQHTVVINENIPATCTKTGLTAGAYCSDCGKVLVNQTPVALKEHIFAKNVCLVCGEIKYSKGLAYKANDDGITCSITGIGSCTDLDIKIPEYIDGYKVTSIGEFAFSGYRCFTSIVIPSSVTSIGTGAFGATQTLMSIIIPNSVTSIGDKAFFNCSSLTSITFEGTITQWNAIVKGTKWEVNVPATKIICSNGTTSLN